MDLKESLFNILEESKLINKFEYWNREEDDQRHDPVEQIFKYRVDAQNRWRIHSLELMKKSSGYKGGNVYKFRVYHDAKMPVVYEKQILGLNNRISNSKTYIDFGANSYTAFVSIAKNINSILESIN